MYTDRWECADLPSGEPLVTPGLRHMTLAASLEVNTKRISLKVEVVSKRGNLGRVTNFFRSCEHNFKLSKEKNSRKYF